MSGDITCVRCWRRTIRSCSGESASSRQIGTCSASGDLPDGCQRGIVGAVLDAAQKRRTEVGLQSEAAQAEVQLLTPLPDALAKPQVIRERVNHNAHDLWLRPVDVPIIYQVVPLVNLRLTK